MELTQVLTNKKTTIKRTALCLVALVAMLLLAASAALAGEQDFTVHNKTGVEIHKLHISPHSSDEWGEDILGQDTLASGESVHIKFSRSEKAAHWDLKVEDSEGHSIEWESLNLLEISEVTLYYKDGKAWAEVI
jgi:hypothetical protein